VPLEHRPVAELIEDRHAGVVDEDVERVDLLDPGLDLRWVGDVECQRRDPALAAYVRLPRPGTHALRAPSQRLIHERPPEATVGPDDQNRAVCDVRAPAHHKLLGEFPR
jgi:hypothetical protein